MTQIAFGYPLEGWPLVGTALAAAVVAGGAVPVGSGVPPSRTALPLVAPAPQLAPSPALPVAARIAAAPAPAKRADKPYFIRLALPAAKPLASAPALPIDPAPPADLALAQAAALPDLAGTPTSEPALVATPESPALAVEPTAATATATAPTPAMPKLLSANGFDLAKLAPGRAPALAQPALAPAKLPRAASGTARKLADRVDGDGILHAMTLRLGGAKGVPITIRIANDGGPTVKLGDLLGLVAGGMDPELSARLSSSGAAQGYVSFAQLRASGLAVAYDAGADTVTIAAE